MAVGAIRLAIGAAGLWAVAGRPAEWARSSRWWVVVGAVAMAGYQLCFFAGVRLTGVALGTVLAIGSGPLFTAVIDRLISGTIPGRRWWVATGVAVAGLMLIAGPTGAGSPAGVALSLGAGACYAMFAVAGKRTVAAVPPGPAMALTFGLAALMLLPLLAVADLSLLATGRGSAVAIWLGVGATSTAYLSYGHGLETTPVTTASTLSLAEPVVATLLGTIVLSERPHPIAWVGMALVGAALTLLATERG
jgi:DME family drug/metabolite transporter